MRLAEGGRHGALCSPVDQGREIGAGPAPVGAAGSGAAAQAEPARPAGVAPCPERPAGLLGPAGPRHPV
jgi:hypothetical protein